MLRELNALVSRAADDRQQPAGTAKIAFLTPVGEEKVRPLHRAEWRRRDIAFSNSRRDQLVAIGGVQVDEGVAVAGRCKVPAAVGEARGKDPDNVAADLIIPP